ncbi:DUF4956 domain-containing protein [Marinilabilia salmonicolor]|jgi:uncharacterized membrane protein|uniref:Uncharacterized protein DUF4956 n=1 Tax=Marinilabilia salmonicolor TaxID=989 RepID=A0A368UP90_9BACT|nr:DUF4956 domain-containing protein [Marinilabilia salmonicolor]RCW30612.1 uncharacterized protein DUF4956 [Marinilabilia salmonicolor]
MTFLTDFFSLTENTTSTSDFSTLLIRFGLNLFITAGIIRLLYYPRSKRRDYFFTFILTSSTIFMLLFLLDTVQVQVGFALGLFAIFGILRYRTDTLPIREMTYLFLIIGISVINALAKGMTFTEISVTNALFIAVTWLMESNRILKHVSTKQIVYEKIELIHPDKRNELLQDLQNRTGINIINVEIGNIDFLKDTALINIYYNSREINYADRNSYNNNEN